MSVMFTNFDITPDTYIPNNTLEPRSTPANPKVPYAIYNERRDIIGYEWNYGDTAYLEFTTTGSVKWDENDQLEGVWEDAETYLRGKLFKLRVLNFRSEVVAFCDIPAAPIVRILSDSFYPNTLVQGVYRLRLDLIDEEHGTSYTLIDPGSCIIRIK